MPNEKNHDYETGLLDLSVGNGLEKSSPDSSAEKDIVESSSVLQHFFPPEIFSDQTCASSQSMKKKSGSEKFMFWLSIIFIIVIIGMLFPQSRLYSAFFGKTALFEIGNTKSLKNFSNDKFKKEIEEIKTVFENKQWNTAEHKSRQLFFNQENRDPDMRKWLYSIRMESLANMGRWINVQGTSVNAAKEFPGFRKAWYYAALGASNQNQFQDAQEYFKKFMAIRDDNENNEMMPNILNLELKIIVGLADFENNATLDEASKIYKAPKYDRVLQIFEKIERESAQTNSQPSFEYLNIKLNFLEKLKDFLTGSFFSSKTIMLNGKVYDPYIINGEINSLKTRIDEIKNRSK